MDNLNYGGLEAEFCRYDQSQFVILPVPYDRTSTWGRGAQHGPAAILEASANMELYDIESDSEPYRAGIFTAAPLVCSDTPDVLYEKILTQARRYRQDGKFLITIGGNHCVPIGSCQAACENQEDVSILQIDAHADMRETYQGQPYSHACAMARMKTWGKPVMVGIRSMDISERENVQQAKVFFASAIRKNPNWIDEVLQSLTDKVYLTIDLDGFDPSIMPATGTPEPGGLLWYETLDLLERVVREKHLLGFDVVELCPQENTLPSHFMAAKLIYKLMAYVTVAQQERKLS